IVPIEAAGSPSAAARTVPSGENARLRTIPSAKLIAPERSPTVSAVITGASGVGVGGMAVGATALAVAVGGSAEAVSAGGGWVSPPTIPGMEHARATRPRRITHAYAFIVRHLVSESGAFAGI